MPQSAILSCPTCSYPLAFQYDGQTAVCAYCGEKVEAVSQGVTVPTPLFAGLIGLGIGLLFGPAIIASSQTGRQWLERQARGG